MDKIIIFLIYTMISFVSLGVDNLPKLLTRGGGFSPVKLIPQWASDGSSFWYFDQNSYTIKYYDHSIKTTTEIVSSEQIDKIKDITKHKSKYQTAMAVKFIDSETITISNGLINYKINLEHMEVVSADNVDLTKLPRPVQGSPYNEIFSPNGDKAVTLLDDSLAFRSLVNMEVESLKTLTSDNPNVLKSITWNFNELVWSDESNYFLIYGEDLSGYQTLTFDDVSSHIYNFDGPVKKDVVLLVDTISKKLVEIPIDAFSGESRSVQIHSFNNGNFIVSSMNYLQNSKVYYKVDLNGHVKKWFEHSSDTFVSDYLLSMRRSNLFLVDGEDYAFYISDESGFQQIYKINDNGSKDLYFSTKTQIDEIIDFNKETGEMIFSSFMVEEDHPYHLHLLKYQNGKVKRLTRQKLNYGNPKNGYGEKSRSGGSSFFELSPSREVIVSTNSSITSPQKSEVIDIKKYKRTVVLESNTENLIKNGYTIPEEFSETLSDGHRVFGIISKPNNFDPELKYPVLEIIYGGPQTTMVDQKFGSYYSRFAKELANEGYIVVMMDTPGTPFRGKKFHDKTFKKFGQVMVKDHKEALVNLAKKHSWIDLSHVTVWGASFGGYQALNFGAREPHFYKRVISESGVFDLSLVNGPSIVPQMQTPTLNPKGYQDILRPELLENLKYVDLNFIHGREDRNAPLLGLIDIQERLDEQKISYTNYIYDSMGHGYDIRKIHTFFDIIKVPIEDMSCQQLIDRFRL